MYSCIHFSAYNVGLRLWIKLYTIVDFDGLLGPGVAEITSSPTVFSWFSNFVNLTLVISHLDIIPSEY